MSDTNSGQECQLSIRVAVGVVILGLEIIALVSDDGTKRLATTKMPAGIASGLIRPNAEADIFVKPQGADSADTLTITLNIRFFEEGRYCVSLKGEESGQEMVCSNANAP